MKDYRYRDDPSFQTDRSGQIVKTQIRLFLKQQSDQGLNCLPFPLYLSYAKNKCINCLSHVVPRTSMFKASVFPNYKTMIRII